MTSIAFKTHVSALAILALMMGCKKNQLASTDTVRTGDGANAKFLIPVPVGQPDGSNAFCVYVAGASTDPNFYTSIGPGNSQNTQVLTAQAIPQADFLQQLRVMPGVGGMGNDIASDVMTASVAFALGSTTLGALGELKVRRQDPALQAGKTNSNSSTQTNSNTVNQQAPVAAGTNTTASSNATQAQSAPAGQAKKVLTIDDIPGPAQIHIQDLDGSMAQILELEDSVEKISRAKVKNLADMLTDENVGAKASKESVAWFQSALNSSRKADFEKFLVAATRDASPTTVDQLAEAIRLSFPNSRVAGAILNNASDASSRSKASRAMAEDLIRALNVAKNYADPGSNPQRFGFRELAEDLSVLKGQQESIRERAINIRNMADELGVVLKGSDRTNLTKLIADQKFKISHNVDTVRLEVEDLVGKGLRTGFDNADAPLLKIAREGSQITSISGLETSSFRANQILRAKETANFSTDLVNPVRRGVEQNADNVVIGIGKKMASSVNEGATATRSFVHNVCMQGGGWARLGKAVGCGLVVAGGAYALKKFAVEPLTAAPKLQQVVTALQDVSTYQNVNEQTFAAIATGISRFQSSVSTSPCQ